MQADGQEAAGAEGRMRIFRAADAPPMIPARERGAVRADHVVSPITEEGIRRFGKSAGSGAAARVMFSSPWVHVSYAWFKSGFPLPLHSHDSDCYYQIVAGSMRLGTEEIGKGDGVLIPAGVPYTVTPGADGVEFLEIRPTGDYDTRYRGATETYWDKIVATLSDRQEIWSAEKAPLGLI